MHELTPEEQEEIGSFKPCFKWLLPKICNEADQKMNDFEKSFKPCFKWLLPKICHLLQVLLDH